VDVTEGRPWSVARIGPSNWVSVREGFVGGSMLAQFASSPNGPWSQEYVIGVPAWEALTSFYYMPYLHKHTVQNGTYSVGYPDIGPDGADGSGPYLSNRPARDQCFYNIQYFLTPNLLAMSPHTGSSFSDNFNNAGDTPVKWKRYGGTWTAASGTYSVNAGSGHKAVALGIVKTNTTVAADVIATNGDAGVILRGSAYSIGADNFRGYYAAIKPGTGVILGRMNGGTWTQLAIAPMSIANGTNYRLKVVASGSTNPGVRHRHDDAGDLRDGRHLCQRQRRAAFVSIIGHLDNFSVQ
jgi:hypothetical protein